MVKKIRTRKKTRRRRPAPEAQGGRSPGHDPQPAVERAVIERALPLMERTVAEQPGHREHRLDLGRAYLLLDRVDDARIQLERTVRETLRAGSGPLVEATVALMRAMTRAGAPAPEMLALLKPVLERRPDHPDLWWAVARAMALGGQTSPAAEAAERVLVLLDRAAVEGRVEAADDRVDVHRLLAGLYWDSQRFPESYHHTRAALDGRPGDASGSGRLLHRACTLALELGDGPRIPALLERLLDHPRAPLDMFFFAIDRLMKQGETTGARAMLGAGRARAPRVADAPRYQLLADRLGL